VDEMSIFSEKKSLSRQRLGIEEEHVVSLDLWEEGVSDLLPRITVSGAGLKLVGTDKEFQRLIKKLV